MSRTLLHVSGVPYPRPARMPISQWADRSSHGSPRRAKFRSSRVPPRPIAGPARSQVPVLRSSKCRLLVQPITGFMAPRPPTRGDSSLLRTLTRHPVPPLTRRVPSCRHAPKSRARLLVSGTLPPGTVLRRLLVNHPSMCLTMIRPDRTS